MSSNESRAYEIMTELGVDYVLVIFGGMIGYSGDDINKFLWMVRIAQGEHPNEINEPDYFTSSGAYSMGSDVSERMKNSLMYKLSYYRFGEIVRGYGQPGGYDLARRQEIGHKDISLRHLEEAFTSENWLVRIYRVSWGEREVWVGAVFFLSLLSLRHTHTHTHLCPRFRCWMRRTATPRRWSGSRRHRRKCTAARRLGKAATWEL